MLAPWIQATNEHALRQVADKGQVIPGQHKDCLVRDAHRFAVP